MANKVKFGIKNVYYAVATLADDGSATYANPKRLRGAVNMSLEPQGESSPFYADDVVYFTGNSNSGYQGDLELAKVTEDFLIDVLGSVADKNGVVYEDANAPVVHFALLFEFDGDVSATKHVLYNCTATRPSVASATKTDTTEPQTETITVTATSVFNTALNKYIPKAYCESTSATQYAAWYESVYQPVASE